MTELDRRSVMTIGAALATGGALSTVGIGGADGCNCPPTREESSGWSSYRGNAGNTGYIPSDGAVPKPEEIAWEYEDAGGTPAVVDGTVYLADDRVHAIDAETGETLWTSDEIGADGTPAVIDGSVVVSGGQLTVLDVESGEIRWAQAVNDAEKLPDPTAADGTVYIATETAVFAYDVTDGSLEWSRKPTELDIEDEVDGSSHSLKFASIPVAVSNESVYTGFTGGTLGFAAFDATTGDTRWTYVGGGNPHRNLIATEDRLYTGRYTDTVFNPVLDTDSGEMVSDIMYMSPPVLADQIKIISDRYGFTAYHTESDDSWSQPAVGQGVDEWGAPNVVGETVLAIHGPVNAIGNQDDTPVLYGLDVDDGSEQWTFPLTEIGIDDPYSARGLNPIAVGDTVYIGQNDRLVALRPGSSSGDTDTQDDETGSDNDDESQDGKSDDGDDETGDDTDESNGDNPERTGEAENDGQIDDGDTDTGGSSDDQSADSDTTGGGSGPNESTGSDENGTDETESADDVPGFTTGAGLISGGLTLEWLRRHVIGDQE